MFAELSWTGSPSDADATLDIVKVLTGETDLNNLSSFINLGASSIASTYPAGWEIVDDDTGVVNEYILRAPIVNDPTTFKYVAIRKAGAVLYYSVMGLYVVSTKARLYETTAYPTGLFRTNVQSYGDGIQTVAIFSSARYIGIRASGYYYGICFPCMEITQTHPSIKVPNSAYIVPAVCIDDYALLSDRLTYYYTRIPRIHPKNAGVLLDNQEIRALATHQRPSCVTTNTEFDSFSTDLGRDSLDNRYYGLHLILFERRELVSGIIGTSEVSDVWFAQGQAVAGFEDKTLHTLDTPDDVRCLWFKTNSIINGSSPRIFIRAE